MPPTPHLRRAKPRRPKNQRTAAGKNAAKTPPAAKSSRDKVRAYRNRMRARGLRLVQIWLPEARASELVASGEPRPVRRHGLSAVQKQAWADAMADSPRTPVTYETIADLIGSIDGLPKDLSARKKEYLRETGYGGKRRR